MAIPRQLLGLALASLLVFACSDGAPTDRFVDAADAGSADADAGIADADVPPMDASPGDAGPPPVTGPVLYPVGRRHSPLTADLVERLNATLAAGPAGADDVFAKVGDSITVGVTFLHCFSGSGVDLAGRDELLASLDAFRSGDAGGGDAFSRTSVAATVGWSAFAALAGDPSPLELELAATSPRFVVLMFGTNDVGWRQLDAFTDDMLTLADQILAAGAVPLMSTIPPRDDDASIGADVPRWNQAIRAVAQGRGVPLVDFYAELLTAPGHGLAGDGVHPHAHPSGACNLSAEGLDFAANVRNLITLEQLDRARRVTALGEASLDAEAPRLTGSGSLDEPFVVPGLPFVALHDTSRSPHRDLDAYTACDPDADESGPELRYALTLDTPGTLSATVVSRDGVDVDVHILSAGGGADDCVARAHRTARAALEAGDYVVVADTFVADGVELSGEYALLLSVE